MKIIGLCGGSGSGKSTAAAVMRSLGAEIIDTDRLYREICVPGSECLARLADEFGAGILLPDGSLDRGEMGALAFSDSEKRSRLNSITHAYIRKETLRRLDCYREEGTAVAVIDAPLLFESGFDEMCDLTLGIVAPTDVRIRRIISRDEITRERAEARIASQLSDSFLRSRCGYIIENNGELCELEQAVAALYKSVIS